MKRFVIITTLVFMCMNILAQGIFSNPEKDGTATAEMLNDYYSLCIDNVRKCEADFVKNFDAKKYTSRKQAIKAYRAELEKVFEDHSKNIDKAENELYEMQVKYEKNADNWNKFKHAYNSNVNKDLQKKVSEMKESKKIPAPIATKIKTITPSYPTSKQMQKDLIGQTLSEGFTGEDAWFHPEQRWTIEKGEIEDFKVVKVLNKTKKDYSVIATMQIVTSVCSYSAEVQLNYILPEINDWQLEFVLSKGIRLNKTGKYDECVSYEIKSDGWGGTYALFISNQVNIELAVLGYIYANKEWKKFNIKLAPNEIGHQVGGVFGGGSVSSYKIEYVERLR